MCDKTAPNHSSGRLITPPRAGHHPAFAFPSVSGPFAGGEGIQIAPKNTLNLSYLLGFPLCKGLVSSGMGRKVPEGQQAGGSAFPRPLTPRFGQPPRVFTLNKLCAGSGETPGAGITSSSEPVQVAGPTRGDDPTSPGDAAVRGQDRLPARDGGGG